MTCSSQPIGRSRAQPRAPQGWEEAQPEGANVRDEGRPPGKETLSRVPRDTSSAAWCCPAGWD